MRSALKGVDGVGAIDIAANTDDFKVHYDSKKIQPAKIVEVLKKGGEPGAKVKS